MANRMVTKGYQKGVYERVTKGIEHLLLAKRLLGTRVTPCAELTELRKDYLGTAAPAVRAERNSAALLLNL
jgi:hypothetical protein